MTSVDIVVPCYNYARYLEWCVDTLVTQRDVDVRVLIIDDASSDDTPAVGSRIAARDPRVEFRRHDTNRGHIATYNEGLLGWARSDYSVLLSADDGLPPGALARATALLEQHPDMGMAYGQAVMITDEWLPNPADVDRPGETCVLPPARFLEYSTITGNPVPTPSAVVRTSVQQAIGGYRPELPHTGDMEMWMRFALHGPIGILNSVQGYYRWHARNMSSGYYGRLLSDRQEKIEACRNLVAASNGRVAAFAGWVDAMSRRLGTEAFWIAGDALDSGDARGCAECLAFATDAAPHLRYSWPWWKLQAKRAMGRPLRTGVQALMAAARGDTAAIARPPAAPPTLYRAGQQIGWWPESPR